MILYKDRKTLKEQGWLRMEKINTDYKHTNNKIEKFSLNFSNHLNVRQLLLTHPDSLDLKIELICPLELFLKELFKLIQLRPQTPGLY